MCVHALFSTFNARVKVDRASFFSFLVKYLTSSEKTTVNRPKCKNVDVVLCKVEFIIRHQPVPLSTKLVMVFADLDERKKLAFSPSFSAAEYVL